MPTPLSRGHGMMLRRSPIDNLTLCPKNNNLCPKTPSSNPLAVVVGWMGAKDSQLKPYLSFYHAHGFDTLSFAVGPMHVLAPSKAQQYMNRVLNTALEISYENTKTDNETDPKDIVFHSFSMGGYLFGQSLINIKNEPEKFGSLETLIKAQIFDSPPDYGSIAYGISRSVGTGGPVVKMVEKVAEGYLALTKNTAGVAHRAASQAFHENYLPAPALWYYSHADPISRYEDCETVVGKWRASGKHVETVVWKDSPHIQHGRVYPEQYFGTLQSFLQRCDVIKDFDQTDSENEEFTKMTMDSG